ncbi:MAG: YCF48-related protein [Balneolaceae bacterium]
MFYLSLVKLRHTAFLLLLLTLFLLPGCDDEDGNITGVGDNGDENGDEIQEPEPEPVATWVQQDSELPYEVILNGVSFRDELNGWAVGTGQVQGVALHTTDGGASWEQLSETSNGNKYSLRDVEYLPSGLAVAVSFEGYLQYRSDGEMNWQVLEFEEIREEFEEGSMRFQAAYALDDDYWWIAGAAVSFSEESGYVIRPLILHTGDGGENWEIQFDPNQTELYNHLLDIYFVDDEYGWAVGSHGNRLHTIDGGVTWEVDVGATVPHLMQEYEDLHSITFINTSTGWMAGNGGVIAHTTNGGASWDIQMEVDSSHPGRLFNSIHFTDHDHGWAVGIDANEDGIIFRTTDGGSEWKMEDSGFGMAERYQSVVFLNPDTGWVVGRKIQSGEPMPFILHRSMVIPGILQQ